MVITQEVMARAASRPESLAVSCPEGDLSYRELDARSARLAARLRASGVGPDAVVGILLERSPAMIVSALGVLRAGGAYLPMDPAGPEQWIHDLVREADCSALISSPSAMGLLPETGLPLLTLDRFGQAIEGESDTPTAPVPPPAPDPKSLAYVIFTSGSTGRPKGVEITHAGLANLVAWHLETFGVRPEDRATRIARVSFDASAWEIWPCLAAGASLHLPPNDLLSDPEGLRDWLVARGITMSFAPTPLAERLVALPWPASTKLRILLTGADTLHRYPPPGLPFTLVNNYGPTECTVVATSCPVPAESDGRRLPPIGRPIANVRTRILDESLRPVPPGASGELYLGGPGVARGYRNRPDLTAERFVADPLETDPSERLFKTGDLVRELPDGQIEFIGRADEQAKIRGFRIEPDQVAATLNLHPEIAESAVVARESEEGGKRLVAYFAARPGARPSPAELRAFVAARLPDYMVPSLFLTIGALPLTPNGKVDRAMLPEPGGAEARPDRAFSPPATETEKTVAAILAPLLGVERIDVNANFFALGGHSLLGTQLIVRLRNALGIELPLRTVFETATVTELSVEIDRRILARLEEMERTPIWNPIAVPP